MTRECRTRCRQNGGCRTLWHVERAAVSTASAPGTAFPDQAAGIVASLWVAIARLIHGSAVGPAENGSEVSTFFIIHPRPGAWIDAGKAAAARAGLSDGRLTPWNGSHR